MTAQRRSILPLAAVVTVLLAAGSQQESREPPAMVRVAGGTYSQGDPFGDGDRDEGPAHEVTVSGFLLAAHEVTVREFRAFVQATSYQTSAENMPDREAQERRLARLQELIETQRFDAEARKLATAVIESGGCGCWNPTATSWDFGLDINWRSPGFTQTDEDPVVCMSWNDAASYCNWLSREHGLPPAYDVRAGELLDEDGRPTGDVTKVKGYRLPTEAEWEYAARERGKKVRFGNGRNMARSDEINFDATRGDHSYLEKGEFREGTVPVGTFKPNSLGLHDMSGNAWEWCSDCYGEYRTEAQMNPHRSGGRSRVIRGGRWGGTAKEVRVFARVGYGANNRCNNSGFRLARTP